MENRNEWRRVVFTGEFGEAYDKPCPRCGEYIDGCMCPGPTMETNDGELFEYKEEEGVMYARPPASTDWNNY